MAQQVYPEDYSCIIDPKEGCGGLYIGNLQAAQNIKNLKRLQIKAVLTAAKGVELGHSKTDIPYFLYIPADDHESFDISKYFHQGANFINDCIQRTNIMIHCLAGVSRSVSLVLSFLIKHRGFTYNRAFDCVKSRRKIIHPNEGFIQLLKKFEIEMQSQIPKSSSVSPTKYSSQRQASLSSSPTKRYAPNKEIQAILQKYQNYKSAALGYSRRNPENAIELRKIESYNPQNVYSPSKNKEIYSPQKSKFRGKRVNSMNVERQDIFENDGGALQFGVIKRGLRKEPYPLQIIQNSPLPLNTLNTSTTDIDKKIQEIRKKYQEYQSPTTYKYSSNYNTDENVNRTIASSASFRGGDYARLTQQRREYTAGEVSSNRLKRLTSLQQY